MTFDCIVIGKGLIGSAAARYLSQTQKVAIIGPDEPDHLHSSVVYASHYDQSRVQRIIGLDSTWTLLNLQSANQYDFLEKKSGIIFHSKVGCLYVNPVGNDNYLNKISQQASLFNLKYDALNNGEDFRKRFPDFHFPFAAKGIFESSPAGHINPRLLIKAQLNLFQKKDGIIVNDVAKDISCKKNEIKITTLQDKIFSAKKVLLAPGAFINFYNLLKIKLAITLKSETTIWAKVSASEAQRLSALPSLLYEIATREYSNVYLVRPLQYPDGNFYLKMGCNLSKDIYFDNINDTRDWFIHGNSDANLDTLKNALKEIIPGLALEEAYTKRCLVSFTKHRKPYIGEVNNNGLYVAAGGNGYSAMCSDALGRIASHLVTHNKFPEEFQVDSFIPVFSN